MELESELVFGLPMTPGLVPPLRVMPVGLVVTVARRYLTEREVERLMDTARTMSRHGHWLPVPAVTNDKENLSAARLLRFLGIAFLSTTYTKSNTSF